jgi:uncharacterized membrane protein (DUF485 family)
MLVIYVGFILLIAFAPAGWARRCMREPASPAGIPIGIGVIVISLS